MASVIVDLRNEIIAAIQAVMPLNVQVKAGRFEDMVSDPGPVGTVRVQWWGGTSSKNQILGSGRSYVYRPEYRVYVSTREAADTTAAELMELIRGALLGTTVQTRFKLEPEPSLESGRTEDYLGMLENVCIYASAWAADLIKQ